MAVLHLVESLLILTSGHRDALPVYVRNHSGKVVGAFNLQKFWPIPLAVMAILTNVPHQLPGDVVRMPDWWPIIRPWEELGKKEVIYTIFPVVAALGYGELALTCTPREKAKRSAKNLALFSLVLLGLAVLASHVPSLAALPALFAPLGHELVIHAGRKAELRGKPAFVSPVRGVMILDVIRGSPAHRAGLGPGCVILSLGGVPVNTREEVAHAFGAAGERFTIEYLDPGGHVRRAEVALEGSRLLGVIFAPEPGDASNVDYSTASPLGSFLRRLRGARGGGTSAHPR